MLRHNVEDEQDKVELSRRSFFSRLAIGAVLSMGVPNVVHATKSSAVKADKNTRLQTKKTAARLPKSNAHETSKAVQKHGKALAGRSSDSHKSALKGKQAGLQAKNSGQHKHTYIANADTRLHVGNERVRDIYHGKKHGIQNVANHSLSNPSHTTRSHSIIQPSPRSILLEPSQESVFLSDHSRLTSHRSLAIQNPHTGDKLSLTYFEKGRYLTDALNEISYLLRDYRTGDIHPIDPELLDQLHDLKQMLGLNQPFDVICGYRSPMTNARLHAEHSGVANNSFHMHGRAVDIRIERLDIRRIRSAAVAMHRGGVGYYPESNFIHLDTGTFRTWTL